MNFPVFFDTCAIYGEIITDLILRLAEDRLFIPYWSSGVLAELERVLSANPGVGQEKIRRRIANMDHAFPDAKITGYEKLTDTMTCDEGDRHVLAAVVHSPAQTLVTFNIKIFPSALPSRSTLRSKVPIRFC